jgi:hypothetical protein
MKGYLTPKLTWELKNSIQLFISSCHFVGQTNFHSLCRRRLITEGNHLVLFSYQPSPTQRMKVHLTMKLTWQLNNSIQLFISPCQFDLQIHFYSLCPRGLITKQNYVVPLSYSPSSTKTIKVHLGIELTSQLNSCIQLFISSSELEPQTGFHSLCRRGLITEHKHLVLFSY